MRLCVREGGLPGVCLALAWSFPARRPDCAQESLRLPRSIAWSYASQVSGLRHRSVAADQGRNHRKRPGNELKRVENWRTGRDIIASGSFSCPLLLFILSSEVRISRVGLLEAISLSFSAVAANCSCSCGSGSPLALLVESCRERG